ncbi:hypothetical protein D3C71_1477090 [compost metagenome]
MIAFNSIVSWCFIASSASFSRPIRILSRCLAISIFFATSERLSSSRDNFTEVLSTSLFSTVPFLCRLSTSSNCFFSASISASRKSWKCRNLYKSKYATATLYFTLCFCRSTSYCVRISSSFFMTMFLLSLPPL